MNVVSRQTILKFCESHAGAKAALLTWYRNTKKAQWATFAEIRKDYPSADWVGDDRVVFNIGGNKYRLIVRISFVYKTIMIKWVGTHAEYDGIDAASVS